MDIGHCKFAALSVVINMTMNCAMKMHVILIIAPNDIRSCVGSIFSIIDVNLENIAPTFTKFLKMRIDAAASKMTSES